MRADAFVDDDYDPYRVERKSDALKSFSMSAFYSGK